MEIKKGYLNSKNEEFNNIRNINFESVEDFRENSGKYICQSTHNDGIWTDTEFDLENGIYLYKPTYDKTKALRVYKDTLGLFNEYKYRGHSDHKIVSKLLERQKYVKLTDFPTGIVTIENYVIGQEIPFYENYQNLSDIILSKKEKEIIWHYINIINILEELYNNGIVYSDVHAKNFMVNQANEMLKLIDFDEQFLSIDNDKKHLYINMIVNIKNMINFINDKMNITFKIKEEETLQDIKKTLTKKL